MPYTDAYALLRSYGYSERMVMRLLHEAYIYGSHVTPFASAVVTHTTGSRYAVTF